MIKSLSENYPLSPPLINYCPNNYEKLHIIESIIANIHSPNISKEKVINGFNKLLFKHSILSDLLETISLTSQNGFIIELIDKKEDFPGFNLIASTYNIKSYYLSEDKIIAINNINNNNFSSNINQACLTHMLAHFFFDNIFKQTRAPYYGFPYDEAQQQNSFNNAKLETLANIQQTLINKFNISIPFYENDNSYEMGKSLRSANLGILITQNKIDEFENILKLNPNINLSQKGFISDNKPSLLDSVFASNNVQAIDIVVKYAKKEDFENFLTLISLINQDKLELINWLIQTRPDIKFSEIKCLGVKASDYAYLKDRPEIFRILKQDTSFLELFTRFFDQEPVPQSFDRDKYYLSSQEINLGNTLTALLRPYLDSTYDIQNEDPKLIASLPEILAATDIEAQNKINHLLLPLENYWSLVISPKVQEYGQLHDESKFCSLIKTDFMALVEDYKYGG